MKPIPHDIVVIELGLEEQKFFEEERTTEYDLSARPAAIAFRGFAATIVYQRITTDHVLEAASGEFNLSGTPAEIGKATREDFGPGAFTHVGMPAIPAAQRREQAGPGAFALAGVGVGFRHRYGIPLWPGAFDLAGLSASFRASSEFSAGEFHIVGLPIHVTAARMLSAAPGAIALTGGPARFTFDKTESFGPGAFSLTEGSTVKIGVGRPMSQESTPVFEMIGSPVTISYEAQDGDENHIVFATSSRLTAVELLNASPATLVHATVDGRGAAVLKSGDLYSATARSFVVWKGKTQDGIYRYLTSMRGTAPASAVRRGALPFARADFTDLGAIRNGYMSGPHIASGATNRFVLNRVAAGVETNIIAENSNRLGTFNQWRWWEIMVRGGAISHRSYLEGTSEESIPTWQTVTDTTFGTGGLHGVGYQQGAGNNSMAIAEMQYIPFEVTMANIVGEDNLAYWTGISVSSNTVNTDNTAEYYA